MLRSSRQMSSAYVITIMKDYIKRATQGLVCSPSEKLNIELISLGQSKYNVVLSCSKKELINNSLSRVKFLGSKRTEYYKKLKTYDLEKLESYSDEKIEKLCLTIIKDNLNYSFERYKLNLKVIKPKISTD